MYERALGLAPRHAPAANNLAYLICEHGGNLARALELARRARELAPANPFIADTLAWCLYKAGAYDMALPLLDESRAALGDTPQFNHHVGMTHFKLGQHVEAQAALEHALELSQDFKGADEARDTLAELNN